VIVLLAAGRGARFGTGKLTADLHGRPLWQWAADAAVAAGYHHRHIITNDPTIAQCAEADGWTVHPNPIAEEGVASSIRIAAELAASSPRLVISLADMPFVEPDHLRRLGSDDQTAFTRQPDGRPGVPAGFPASALSALQALAGNRGAGGLDWPAAKLLDVTDTDCLFDVDTATDLDAARSIAIRRAAATFR
jgi:molybdenum cofactor cytidylyltransferase